MDPLWRYQLTPPDPRYKVPRWVYLLHLILIIAAVGVFILLGGGR